MAKPSIASVSDDMVTIVIQAINSERERCAKIASDAVYPDECGPQESAWNAACQHIAETLRNQKAVPNTTSLPSDDEFDIEKIKTTVESLRKRLSPQQLNQLAQQGYIVAEDECIDRQTLEELKAMGWVAGYRT
jgi:hypothetical protein